jgi:putative mRNA 3-end processing factor
VIDPVAPAPVAVITHGHADHCRPGSGLYVVSEDGAGVVQKRLGEVAIRIIGYGERARLGDVTVSLHPAGHVLGSVQVLVEGGGERWLVTGDTKVAPDPTCRPREVVKADVLVTEATFALPIYRWPAPEQTISELLGIHAAAAGRPVIVFAYALGKAQRILALLGGRAEVLVHGAALTMNEVYRAEGVTLPETRLVVEASRAELEGAIVLAPLSSRGTPWMKRFRDPVQCFASGHMLVRGERRRRQIDHGIVLSDHADWEGLLSIALGSEARRVLVTHGHSVAFARALRERGLDAAPLEVHGWAGEPVGDTVADEGGA